MLDYTFRSKTFFCEIFWQEEKRSMDPQDREKLKKNLVTLVKGLTLDEEFIANLESEGMLTTAMVEQLLTRPEMTKRVSHFVSSLLPRRGPRAFETFIKTCVMTGQVRSTPFTSLEHE